MYIELQRVERQENWSRRQTAAAGIGLFLWWLISASCYAAERKRFTIRIADGRVPAGGKTLRVTEGDNVEIEFVSDRKLTLHLHGIDFETTVSPGQPALMRFDATVTGRFPVEAHGDSTYPGLIYLEIYPR